jgi:membrane protein
VLIIAVWVGASLLFHWYVGSVANFKTPSGQLTIVLVLTGYLFTTSLIFLLGVQLDELVRKRRER